MNLVILLGIVNYLMAIVTYNKVLSQTVVADLWDGLNAGTDFPPPKLNFKKNVLHANPVNLESSCKCAFPF